MGSLFFVYVHLTNAVLYEFNIDRGDQKMEHYCAYQERCHKEVVEKLRGMRMIPRL